MKVLSLLFISLVFGKFSLGKNKVSNIDTTLTIDIGGLRQVVKLKGNHSAAPILLYLHGAGNSSYSLIANGDALTSMLQEHFVLALWDQREYGKTFELNKSPKSLTVKLLDDDTKELVDFLLKFFDRKKIYILAHSMGCVMGIHIAQKYPELLYGLIEMSPPVNGIESQKIGLDMLKKHFAAIHNERAVKELATVKLPARDFESLFVKYIWQTEFDGEHVSDTVREQLKPLMRQYLDGPFASLSNEVFEMNFIKQYPVLKCPVYFFVGRKDFVTNATLTKLYYEKLVAPKKKLFWFEKSGHGIPNTEPELMQEIVINEIL